MVRDGDTLSKIAAKYHIIGGWQALYKLNRAKIGSDHNVIHEAWSSSCRRDRAGRAAEQRSPSYCSMGCRATGSPTSRAGDGLFADHGHASDRPGRGPV
jgi:LysM domain